MTDSASTAYLRLTKEKNAQKINDCLNQIGPCDLADEIKEHLAFGNIRAAMTLINDFEDGISKTSVKADDCVARYSYVYVM